MAGFSEGILHVDMDAFFVEVERLHRPELRGVPVAVGGAGPRGVVASASYEARSFGVHSAMPSARARRLCPDLTLVPTDHARYRRVSEELFAIFRDFTPLVEGLSLDEAFLDVTGLRRHFSDTTSVGLAIKERIRIELGLPASVGIARTKLVAKLASEAAKPDGLRLIRVEEEIGFLHALPVRSLSGVGEATWAALERLGVKTVGDLAALPADVLTRKLGVTLGAHLRDLSHGLDPRPVTPDSEAKSISVEHTYDTDLIGHAAATAELNNHCERLAYRLRRSGLAGRTINLKVRYSNFESVTRAATLPTPTDQSREIREVVTRLAGRVDWSRPVRLLGVGVAALVPCDSAVQLTIDADPRWERISAAVDEVRARYRRPHILSMGSTDLSEEGP
jgi:DNA polymerase-4